MNSILEMLGLKCLLTPMWRDSVRRWFYGFEPGEKGSNGGISVELGLFVFQRIKEKILRRMCGKVI